MTPDPSDARPVAVVFSGGGARGAYEAGALAELLPHLAERGEVPSVFVGASAGAVNAAAAAGLAGRDPGVAAEHLRRRWLEVIGTNVLRPVVRHTLPRLLARAFAGIATPGGARIAGLLDASPFAANLDRWIDWRDLHDNVDRGVVGAVAVGATNVVTRRAACFVEGAGAPPPSSARVDYVRARLAVEHLRASTALPLALAPVLVREPAEARGWYADGSVALHRPLKPALDLGAGRLIVLSDGAPGPSEDDAAAGGRRPGLPSSAMVLMTALVADTVARDVRRLAEVNRAVAGGAAALDRRVPYLSVAPSTRSEIADLAHTVIRSRTRGLRRSADLTFLRRALGEPGPRQADLLSYLLFDREFLEELLRLGARDARRSLETRAGTDGPWIE